MSTDQQRRWCLFTSAGDKSAIRLWLKGDESPRWDLVAAYYGHDDDEYAKIGELCSYVFRTKGSKFQNLKQLIMAYPQFLERYSYVWVCDNDIRMSSSQINEAFEITERLGFWVAQPADLPEGRNSHWITCFAGPGWDYRIVNYVEVRMPIFRRDKLIEFLAVYDGSLVGWGIDYWYANFFKADEFGRFAIIDKVQVTNPRNPDSCISEIDSLQDKFSRFLAWKNVREKYGLIEYPYKVFSYCKLAPLPMRELLTIGHPWLEASQHWGWHTASGLVKGLLIARALLLRARRSGWRDAIWFLRCGLLIRRQRRAALPPELPRSAELETSMDRKDQIK